MPFEVGDRVRLVSIERCSSDLTSNTIGNVGTVVEVNLEFGWPYRVQWDNGSRNRYQDVHLEHEEKGGEVKPRSFKAFIGKLEGA